MQGSLEQFLPTWSWPFYFPRSQTHHRLPEITHKAWGFCLEKKTTAHTLVKNSLLCFALKYAVVDSYAAYQRQPFLPPIKTPMF